MPKVPGEAELAAMHLLNPAQREKIEEDNAQLRRGLGMGSMDGTILEDGQTLRDLPDSRYPVPDATMLRESLRRNEQTLKAGSPPRYSPWQLNGIYKQVKEWSEDIRVGMPSHDQMQRDTWEHIQLHTTWEERKQRRVEAWRNGMRILDPQREDISVEMLRPTTPSPVNYKAYLDGFEHMEWAKAQEIEREMEELDPEVYAAFCKYHGMAPSLPKLVMQKAHLTQAQYEACKRRWSEELAAEGMDEALAEDLAPRGDEGTLGVEAPSASADYAQDELERAIAYFDKHEALTWGNIPQTALKTLKMPLGKLAQLHAIYKAKRAAEAAA